MRRKRKARNHLSMKNWFRGRSAKDPATTTLKAHPNQEEYGLYSPNGCSYRQNRYYSASEMETMPASSWGATSTGVKGLLFVIRLQSLIPDCSPGKINFGEANKKIMTFRLVRKLF